MQCRLRGGDVRAVDIREPSDDPIATLPQRPVSWRGRRAIVVAVAATLTIGAAAAGFSTDPGRPPEAAVSDGTSNT
jgi:hypothetical protein